MKSDQKKLYPIGKAVSRLKNAYPSLSISKVRYLEDEGLLAPRRTKGGYRQFGEDDILRLEEILKLQRDYFLPLHVIKEKMRDWDASKAVSKFRLESEKKAASQSESENEVYSADQAQKNTGVTADQLKGLENFGLLNPKQSDNGKMYDGSDITVMMIFHELSRYGIEPRHLRIYENMANKELMLFQQILSPKLRNKNRESKRKIRTDLTHLTELTDKLQRLLRKKAQEHSNIG